MKKYILSLLVLPLLFVGFSYGQFFQDYEIYSEFGGFISSDLPLSPGQGIKFNSISEGTSAYFKCNYVYGACPYRSSPISLDYGSDNYGKLFILPDNCSSCYITISHGRNVTLKYQIALDKMPVSQLSPVINGLKTSINEFIPYIIYIGLGVLGVIIGFVAIKRLINRVRAKIFSAFK